MAMPSVEPLALLPDEACARLRERLRASGYDGAFLGEAESVAEHHVERVRLPLVRLWLEGRPGPAADLASLFTYDGALAPERVHAALGEDLTGLLIGAGFLLEMSGTIRSPFLMIPLGSQWFLSDRLERGEDAVMGPGMTTLLLHQVIAELPAASLLDLGCGAASLAIDAAGRGVRAVAADLSPRATAIARFNARLNGVTIETATGDGLAAVGDRRFGLIVTQPPYVSMPDDAGAATTYLHGGRRGDELALRFVADCARALDPGGIAALHFDSLVTAGAPLPERVRAAIGDAPVESLALVSRGAPLDVQAILYSTVDQPELGADYARAARARRTHFEALGAKEVSQVLLLLRRPPADVAAAGRYHIVLEPAAISRLRAGAIRDILSGLDLAAGPVEALLAARVRPQASATFAGTWDSPADEAPRRLEVRFGPGEIARDRELGDRGWLLFGLLDGTRTVAEAVAPYAEACETDEAAARREVVEFVRDALARGLLRNA